MAASCQGTISWITIFAHWKMAPMMSYLGKMRSRKQEGDGPNSIPRLIINQLPIVWCKFSTINQNKQPRNTGATAQVLTHTQIANSMMHRHLTSTIHCLYSIDPLPETYMEISFLCQVTSQNWQRLWTRILPAIVRGIWVSPSSSRLPQ